MSAYVVDKSEIDLLVRFALEGTRSLIQGQKFQWWEVDAEGKFAGWRYLDRYADGTDPAKVTPSQFGQILVSENVASVSHRYSEPGRVVYYGPEAAASMEDTEDEDLPGPCDRYVYADPGRTMTPGELFAAIDCLDYQSCEHDGWETSEAYAILRTLREAGCRIVTQAEEDAASAPAAPVAEVKPARHLTCAETAKLLRAALRTGLPGVRFSVRSKTYSGGASIFVSWTDGPTSKQVDEIAQRFAGASFDGMVDLKSYHESEHEGERVHFGADYVFCQRRESDAWTVEVLERIVELAGPKFAHLEVNLQRPRHGGIWNARVPVSVHEGELVRFGDSDTFYVSDTFNKYVDQTER